MQTLSGEVKGKHDGLMYYTIGQRHDLVLVVTVIHGLLLGKT